MRHYEVIVIFSPQLAGEKLDEVVKSFDDQVRKLGGKVLGKREMGRRAFGYMIKKQRDGLYALIDFDVEPSKVSDLRRTLSLTDGILRFSIFAKAIIAQKQAAFTHHSKIVPPTVKSAIPTKG